MPVSPQVQPASLPMRTSTASRSQPQGFLVLMDTHGQFLQECELLGQQESGRRWKLQLFQEAPAPAAKEVAAWRQLHLKAIVRDLELTMRDWAADLRGGYFRQASAPWERRGRCNHEESESIPRCSILIRSYNLRRIPIALGAVIAEMAFPGRVRTDISRNDRQTSRHSSPAFITVLIVWILYSQIPRIDF
jgi:hypothetical protein